MTLSIGEMCRESNQTAVEHGWYKDEAGNDVQRNFGEVVALMHSELSEALEEWRERKPVLYYREDGKPEGVLAEFADVLIRIGDTCAHEGWDLERAVREKMAYNRTRPYRHGNKRA